METTTEKFMGKTFRLGQRPGQELLPKQDIDVVGKAGREMVLSYLKIAQEGLFLSRQHEKRVTEFFQTIGVLSEGETLEKVQNLSTEDLTLPNNTALYATVLRAVVERSFRPNLVANGVIKTISMNPSGMKSLTVPTSALRTAAALPTTGVLPSPSNDDYGSTEITIGWIYAYEVITIQTIRQGVIDIMQDQMFELGDALSRKVDADILDAFQDAAPTDNSNSNYLDAGAALEYADLIKGIFGMQNNNAVADAIVTDPLTWRDFMLTDDVKGTFKFSTSDAGSIFPKVMDFYTVKVLLSTNVNSGNVFLVDSTRCGYLVEASGIEMLDGRKSGTVNWEIIALKLFGVEIVKTSSVFRLTVTGYES